MQPIKIQREHKLQISSSIQDYLDSELSFEIGQLASENLLDFMLKELTPHIYNQALADARKVIEQKMVSLEEEMYALERPLPLDRR
jgi:uncharacterized protein (DUF2164 family)